MKTASAFADRAGLAVPIIIMGLFSTISLLGTGCSPSANPLPEAAPSNPLPECPDTPNCVRTSETYSTSADTLFATTQRALESLGPVEIRLSPDSMRASAVYRVALVFKDDVDVAVHSRDDSSALHVRSASRVGQSDLGVNRRRVQRLLEAIRGELSRHAL